MSTMIIAEAGVNHNGDLGRALCLIDEAARAGADYVKFQTFKAERLVTATAETAEYQKAAVGAARSQFEMLRELELDEDDHQRLVEHCRKSQIGFLSSAFDIKSLEFLLDLGIDRIKVPSGEMTDLPYLRRVGQAGLPVLLSTGMANLGEIEWALEVLEQSGCARQDITVLHCHTDYPTRMEDANLRAIPTIASSLQVQVGYSDHTLGIEAAIAAVALGAQVIEKHFTLDRELPGPDHRASLEPGELGAMVQAIRHLERALGDGRKHPTDSELSNLHVIRKSIVAARPIRAGERLLESNLAVKRPGRGISPMHWDAVVGRLAVRDYEADEPIEW